jgi:hypothetical protein
VFVGADSQSVGKTGLFLPVSYSATEAEHEEKVYRCGLAGVVAILAVPQHNCPGRSGEGAGGGPGIL